MDFLGRVWRIFARSIVADVPPEIQACELCRAVECDPETMRSCSERLEAERVELELREGVSIREDLDTAPVRSMVRPIVTQSHSEGRSASGSR